MIIHFYCKSTFKALYERASREKAKKKTLCMTGSGERGPRREAGRGHDDNTYNCNGGRIVNRCPFFTNREHSENRREGMRMGRGGQKRRRLEYRKNKVQSNLCFLGSGGKGYQDVMVNTNTMRASNRGSSTPAMFRECHSGFWGWRERYKRNRKKGKALISYFVYA